MQAAPEKKNGEDGLPIPPYAVYNIGNNQPENLLDFVDILQQELTRAEVLPADYDFEAHKKQFPMQPALSYQIIPFLIKGNNSICFFPIPLRYILSLSCMFMLFH